MMLNRFAITTTALVGIDLVSTQYSGRTQDAPLQKNRDYAEMIIGTTHLND
jgi:hypothetical protein